MDELPRVASLPAGFRWGAAVSAYQIEGAVSEDGRGESIWDRFCATPGRIARGDTGAVACDSYHRHGEDVELMRQLGLDAFRFSVAWPRVLPEGRGRVEPRGLDFYDRLVDELLAAGIEPFVTLYHWDLPEPLEDAGGWPARATAEAFAAYAEVVARRLGDRVRHWITQNEPWVIAWLGYGTGEHAPGRTSERDAVAAAHHVLLSHALATEVLRSEAPGAEVGVTIDLVAFEPATQRPADLAATARADAERNRWLLEPVLLGSYPRELPERLAAVEPFVRGGDLEAIAAPIDFLGINYYARNVIRAGAAGAPEVVEQPDAERTAMGWEVYAPGLTALLERLRGEYGAPPIYVTENGAAYDDRPVDGRIRDAERTAYLARHLHAIEDAIAAGVDVRGYFVWSLLDNFEWAWGYSQRFGLVQVDFETLERTPKASFEWYRNAVSANRRRRRSALGPRALA